MTKTLIRFRASIRLLALASLRLNVLHRASGQSLYGGLVGTVADNSGASVPHAMVTVTNMQTGSIGARTATTNETGDYSFPTLPPGVYSLAIRADGFRPCNLTGITGYIGHDRPHRYDARTGGDNRAAHDQRVGGEVAHRGR